MMTRILRAAAAFLALAPAIAFAQMPAPDTTPLSQRLPGNTVSAVLFLPQEGKTGETLDRVVFQAYFRPGGGALMRRWDGARDAYTTPADGRWSISGDTLCLSFPDLAGPEICVETHTWGPRIAGNTAGPGRFALLDGNIEPGNSIIASR
jgi:hypothetical protein